MMQGGVWTQQLCETLAVCVLSQANAAWCSSSFGSLGRCASALGAERWECIRLCVCTHACTLTCCSACQCPAVLSAL